jgi:lipid-binding SYLF domain-containing protein
MSYVSSASAPFLITAAVAGGFNTGGQYGNNVWGFKTTDALATVVASSFITNGFKLGMRPYDTVMFIDTTNTLGYMLFVSAVTTSVSTGAATLKGFTVTS